MKYFTAKPIGLYNDKGNIIPADAIRISEEQYQLLLDGQRNGKFIQADAAGAPVLVDELPLTHEKQVEIAKGERASRLAIANAEIAWRQDAVDAGIATEEEAAALSEWKKHRVMVMRVDTSKPEWPTPPATEAT